MKTFGTYQSGNGFTGKAIVWKGLAIQRHLIPMLHSSALQRPDVLVVVAYCSW